MDNIFISSAKKDEELESFVKSKRKELEKMIPGFADDEKFNELVLNFYERGIRDGIDFGMTRMKQQIMKNLPIWKKSKKLIEGSLLDRGILYISRYMIELSELKKLPKED